MHSIRYKSCESRSENTETGAKLWEAEGPRLPFCKNRTAPCELTDHNQLLHAELGVVSAVVSPLNGFILPWLFVGPLLALHIFTKYYYYWLIGLCNLWLLEIWCIFRHSEKTLESVKIPGGQGRTFLLLSLLMLQSPRSMLAASWGETSTAVCSSLNGCKMYWNEHQAVLTKTSNKCLRHEPRTFRHFPINLHTISLSCWPLEVMHVSYDLCSCTRS